ncbi:MAG: DUF4837 family protein [Bacteroidota bacterium]
MRIINLSSNMKYFAIACLSLVYISLFTACASEGPSSLRARPTAFGKANQVVVITDQDVWDGMVGDTLRQYFSSSFLILPQPEPIFDLKHFTPQQLLEDPLRKELRTYILLGNTSDPNSNTGRLISKDVGQGSPIKTKSGETTFTRVAQDKWASGQLLIYLYGNNDEEMISTIKNNFNAAIKRIQQADVDQLTSTVYQRGQSKDLQGILKSTFNLEMGVPADYILAMQDENTVWMRHETEFVSTNIMVHKYKYTQKEQLSKQGIIDIRNVLGKRLVSTEIENTYMRVNDIDLPMYTKVIDVNGRYTIEARGIWDIVNDFMGGPFMSYLIHNPDTNELLFIDGFVYAPGKQKRRYMQYLELILSSAKF